MTFSTKLFVKFFCKSVGQDQFGNNYYQTKKKDSSGKYKRIVLYKGMVDGSKIPALWNAWLHYTIDDIPNRVHYREEKTHVPNLTGSDYAYVPKGHCESLRNGKRDKATGDYQAWKPL